MPNSLIQRMIATYDPTFLGGLHLVFKGVFSTRGYQWELRRNGEAKLGYWKKSLRTRNQRSVYPKRFVLIPGFGDSPLSWHIVISLLQPILKQNYDEVILFDFPGFGGFLSREKAFPSFDLMVSSLNDALDSLKPHTIMGHSLGGWLTALYAGACGAAERPISNKLNYSGPKKILLANPSGIFPDRTTRDEWEGRFRNAMKEGFSIMRPHLFAKEPPWFKLIASHFSKFFAREDILTFMDSFREDHAPNSIAPKIRSDVWLIWGEHDTLIPASCAPAWLSQLNPEQSRNHRAVLIKKAGHSPHLETPGATAVVVGQILSGKVPHPYGKRWWKVLENRAISTG